MRSRYAAYALGKVGYIIKTTHPASPHFETDTAAWRRDLKRFCDSTTFASLTILATTTDGDSATVHFRAGLLQDGRDASFIENSRFLREGDSWLYDQAI